MPKIDRDRARGFLGIRAEVCRRPIQCPLPGAAFTDRIGGKIRVKEAIAVADVGPVIHLTSLQSHKLRSKYRSGYSRSNVPKECVTASSQIIPKGSHRNQCQKVDLAPATL